MDNNDNIDVANKAVSNEEDEDKKKHHFIDDNIDKKKFGADIKTKREEAGKSQEEYAKVFCKYVNDHFHKAISVNQVAWAYYETGKRIPSLDRFYDLCSFMKLKPKDYMQTTRDDQDDTFDSFDKNAFREALKDTRREHKLTLRQAAKLADIPEAVYVRIEKSGIANIHNFVQLCRVFSLDPNDYLYPIK
jgi:transcriptional regulator with XRE-family HTH domain